VALDWFGDPDPARIGDAKIFVNQIAKPQDTFVIKYITNLYLNEPKFPDTPMKPLFAPFLLAADTRKIMAPFHNRIRKACALIAATLILPALAYAGNNQGDEGPCFKPGIPNGTYVFNITGLGPAIPPATGLASLAAVGRVTYFANGTTSGVTSFSFGGTVHTGVTFVGTFTVNEDGSVSETDQQTSPPGLLLHFNVYSTPDANTLTIVQTDAGTIASGFDTRGR
jgi:hypothetical protein